MVKSCKLLNETHLKTTLKVFKYSVDSITLILVGFHSFVLTGHLGVSMNLHDRSGKLKIGIVSKCIYM